MRHATIITRHLTKLINLNVWHLLPFIVQSLIPFAGRLVSISGRGSNPALVSKAKLRVPTDSKQERQKVCYLTFFQIFKINKLGEEKFA